MKPEQEIVKVEGETVVERGGNKGEINKERERKVVNKLTVFCSMQLIPIELLCPTFTLDFKVDNKRFEEIVKRERER